MSEKITFNSAMTELFAWLEKNIDTKSALYQTAHSHLKQERSSLEKCDTDKPFLSVITRTQGKRPEMLTEVLLALTGQTNTNFELLLMGHNLSDKQQHSVEQLIADLPAWMQERTRLIPVTGGTRTTPLNAGFSAAKGSYMAVLDDDDLIFDTWVEHFYRAALEHNGKILHAYPVFQDWKTLGGQYPDTTRAVGGMQTMYCKDFIFSDQLNTNFCPPCGLAFPAHLFHELGIHFDETLNTTEDWDFLMRGAFLCGVHNIQTVTCIYRNWVNAENSRTLHDEAEWMKNYNIIRNRLATIPAVLTPAAVSDLITPLEIETDQPQTPPPTPDAEIFYDCGKGFQESDKRTCKYNDSQEWPIIMSGLGNAPISALRLDPCSNACATLGELRIKILTVEGKELNFGLRDIATNGVEISKHIIFIKPDPQIILHLPKAVVIDRIFMDYDFQPDINDEAIRVFTSRFPFLYRLRRKMRHILGRA